MLQIYITIIKQAPQYVPQPQLFNAQSFAPTTFNATLLHTASLSTQDTINQCV